MPHTVAECALGEQQMNFPFSVTRGCASRELKQYRRRSQKEQALQMAVGFSLCLFILCVSVTGAAVAQQMISAPEPKTGTIIGTVIDVNDGTVPDATVFLQGDSILGPQHVVTNDNGFFQLDHVKPGTPYHVTV